MPVRRFSGTAHCQVDLGSVIELGDEQPRNQKSREYKEHIDPGLPGLEMGQLQVSHHHEQDRDRSLAVERAPMPPVQSERRSLLDGQ
jgi:hypothetical protein